MIPVTIYPVCLRHWSVTVSGRHELPFSEPCRDARGIMLNHVEHRDYQKVYQILLAYQSSMVKQKADTRCVHATNVRKFGTAR